MLLRLAASKVKSAITDELRFAVLCLRFVILTTRTLRVKHCILHNNYKNNNKSSLWTPVPPLTKIRTSNRQCYLLLASSFNPGDLYYLG